MHTYQLQVFKLLKWIHVAERSQQSSHNSIHLQNAEGDEESKVV